MEYLALFSIKLRETESRLVDRAPAWCSGGNRFKSLQGLQIFSLSHARGNFNNLKTFKCPAKKACVWTEERENNNLSKYV